MPNKDDNFTSLASKDWFLATIYCIYMYQKKLRISSQIAYVHHQFLVQISSCISSMSWLTLGIQTHKWVVSLALCHFLLDQFSILPLKKSPFLQDSPRKTPWFFLVKALLFHNIILNPRNSPVFSTSINQSHEIPMFFSFFPMSFPFFHHFAPGELPRGTPPGSPGSPLRRVAPRQLRDGPGRCLGGAGHGGGHLGAGQCLGDVSSWGIIYG